MFGLLQTWEMAATQSLKGSISWQHEDRNLNNGNAVPRLDVNSGCTIGPEGKNCTTAPDFDKNGVDIRSGDFLSSRARSSAAAAAKAHGK